MKSKSKIAIRFFAMYFFALPFLIGSHGIFHDHKKHVSPQDIEYYFENGDDCSICDYQKNQTGIFPSTEDVITVRIFIPYFNSDYRNPESNPSKNYLQRGPPTI